MKKTTFLILLVLLIAASWVWWRTHRPATHVTQRPNVIDTNSSNPPSSPVQRKQTSDVPTVTNLSQPTPESNPAAWIEWRLKQMEEDRQKGLNEWRTPIEFYGKVVDENMNPVASAEVDFDCNDISRTGTSFYHTQSDVDGLFSIKNIQGKILGATVSKQGYYTSKRDNNNFEYGDRYNHFVPDANNPVVFHLRKKGIAEPLIAIGFPGFAKIVQLRRDGSPVEIDLMKGAIVPVGNGLLKLELWGDPIERSTRTFNWKCRLSVEGGGLIETDKEFDFKAPENGYEPSIGIEMPASGEKWRTEIKRKYFIQLPGGKYGRIEFYLLARNGVYTIQSFINPSGSRNLEFDPAKVIRVSP